MGIDENTGKSVQTNTGRSFLTVRKVKYCSKSSKEIRESPFLKMLESQRDMVLSNLLKGP